MKFVPKGFSKLYRFTLLLSFLTLNEPALLQAQWTLQNSTTEENLRDVVMLDSVTAVAVGRGRSILRTSDAGKTWINTTIMLSSVVPWNAVSFCNDTLGIASGDGQIRITYDAGKMWMFGSIPYFRKYISALFISPDNVYVGDDSGYVHHSTDTANTWRSIKLADLPIRSIYTLPDSTPIYPQGVRVVFALTENSLFIKEGESEWKLWGTLDLFQGLGSMALDGGFSEDGTEFIVGVHGDKMQSSAIIRLRPQDSHWYSVWTGTEGVFTSISVPESDVIYICGTGGKILKSTNNGDAWIQLSSPTMATLNSIFFFDNKHGFAVGDSGTILYTSNGGITKNFTAEYWFRTADSLCKITHKEADIRSITSDDVSADGKSGAWKYKFMWYDQPNDRAEYLYFHNEYDRIVLDSISLSHDCCVMNITKDWIDSDSALANAEAYGGKEFREQNPDHSISAVLNQALVPDSHPYWCITYKSDTEESITFMKCIDAEKAITSSDESSLAPMEFQLYQNYPNPFNPNTKIKYRIPYNVSAMNDVNQSYKVTLKIFDILGNETAELVNRDQFPGEYEIEFSQEQISSGIYFYVLSAGNKNLSRKMILLR